MVDDAGMGPPTIPLIHWLYINVSFVFISLPKKKMKCRRSETPGHKDKSVSVFSAEKDKLKENINV